MRVQRSPTRARAGSRRECRGPGPPGTAGGSRSGRGRGRRLRGLPAGGAPGAGSGEAARGGGGARGAEPGPSGLPGVGGVWVRPAPPLGPAPEAESCARDREAGGPGRRGAWSGTRLRPAVAERRGREPAGPEEAVPAVPAAGEASRGCPRASAPPSSPAGKPLLQ